MKKTLYLLITLLSILSCEEVVDINVPESTPRLVIDASIERQFSGTGDFIGDVALVNLSLTTPFFSEEPKFINNAEVVLTDVDNNKTFRFQSVDLQGNFEIIDSSFEILNDVEYKLTVIYDNEAYESTEVLNFSTPFTNIEQIENDNNAFGEDDIIVDISFVDLIGQDNFYFLDLGDANITSIDDEFFTDGEEIKFSYFFEDTVTLDQVFKLYGSDKRLNTFQEEIELLSSGDTNGPFSTVPFRARGNIVNTTNADNFPFGYFRVSEVYFASKKLFRNEDFVAPTLN